MDSLVEEILEVRNYSERPFIKIGKNGGQGSLKVALSVDEEVKEWRKRKEEKLKYSGVKRCILIAVPTKDFKESYENLRLIFVLLKRNQSMTR